MIIVGFTGNRDVLDPEKTKAAVEEALSQIMDAHPKEAIMIRNGCADGFDSIAIEAGMDVGVIRYELFNPYVKNLQRFDYTAGDMYQGSSDKAYELTKKLLGNRTGAALELNARNYHILMGINDVPVDYLIAYSHKRYGGTVNCLKMAKYLGIKNIIYI